MLLSSLRNKLHTQLKFTCYARHFTVKSISCETMQILDPVAKEKELFYKWKTGTKEVKWFESERCVSTILDVDFNPNLDSEYPTKEHPRYGVSINLKLSGYEEHLQGRNCSDILDKVRIYVS